MSHSEWIRVPDVVIGETRSASDDLKQYMRAEATRNDACLLADFSLFRVKSVHFNFEKKEMVVIIQSVGNPNWSGGYPAGIIETCKVVEHA